MDSVFQKQGKTWTKNDTIEIYYRHHFERLAEKMEAFGDTEKRYHCGDIFIIILGPEIAIFNAFSFSLSVVIGKNRT